MQGSAHPTFDPLGGLRAAAAAREAAGLRRHLVPRVAGDDEFLCGWQNVPQRPTNDDAWFILDSSHDRTTTWGRWHEVEGCA